MSLLAAGCYLVAAIGFAYRRRWTWYLAVVMLAFETVMVVLVGGVSLVGPTWSAGLSGANSARITATSRSFSRSSA
jgi:hypothetical protein